MHRTKNWTRRSALAAIGASGVVGFAGCTTMTAPRQPFFDRVGLPIGLQIYTLGEEAAQDLDATFASVAEIGYREIELPGLLGHDPAKIRSAADRAGLAIGSVHIPIAIMDPRQQGGLSFATDPSEMADTLGRLGSRWAVAPIGLFPSGARPREGEDITTAIARGFAEAGPDIWEKTAEILNRGGAALKPLGVKVGYHNHALEFAPVGDTTGWEIIRSSTDPELVSFEVDFGWIATAGLDPVAFLEEHSGRVALAHVKDVAPGNPRHFALSMKPAEVGDGTLDWSRILPAAHAAGVHHFYVEQEPPFSIPRLEAARRGYNFLAKVN